MTRLQRIAKNWAPLLLLLFCSQLALASFVPPPSQPADSGASHCMDTAEHSPDIAAHSGTADHAADACGDSCNCCTGSCSSSAGALTLLPLATLAPQRQSLPNTTTAPVLRRLSSLLRPPISA